MQLSFACGEMLRYRLKNVLPSGAKKKPYEQMILNFYLYLYNPL